MSQSLSRLEPIVYAVLRILAGALMACHGMQKLFGALGGHAVPVGSQLWIGAVIELVGGALVALGLFTRQAAFLVSGTMAVAYIQFHWQGALDLRFLPAVNGGELAVVYCFVYLLFFVRGSGPLAVRKS